MSNASSQSVYGGCFADPFVWKHAEVYYAGGSGNAEAGGVPKECRRVIPLRWFGPIQPSAPVPLWDRAACGKHWSNL